MMDLVQRLKNCLDDPDRIGWYWLLRDAAKEIERLRAELARAKSCACADCNTEILQLRAEAEALQARIDELMFEYCPDEMPPEQVANWVEHQKPVSPEMLAAIQAALAAKGDV